MSVLVGYASSDEEDDIQPERPAKIARTDAPSPDRSPRESSDTNTAPPLSLPVQPQFTSEDPTTTETPPSGPSAPLSNTKPSPSPTTSSAPASPYTTERQRLHSLTMPSTPNFHIPDSPSPPPLNSESAADLATTTKKFERFLELKRQGVHFNARLQNTSSLRNPSLLPKLMEFAGVGLEDSYASTLPVGEGGGGVPARWPERCYVEELMKGNERRVKEMERTKAKGQGVEFVSATKGEGGKGKEGMPQNVGVAGKEKRESRFDQ